MLERWTDMRVLVTGGAGYIGSVLVPVLLEAGHDVTVYDSLMFGGESLLNVWHHPAFNFVKGDFREIVAFGDVDAVVHLAALVGEPACERDEVETKIVNHEATVALAEATCKSGVKHFLFASTCSNYGKAGGEADESSPLVPLSTYAEMKIAAEQDLLTMQSDGFRVLVMRFATAYGLSPRMRFDTLLNEFCRDAVCKGWLDVRNPESWRPFVHVRDIARYVLLLLEYEGCSGIYNVGGHNLCKMDIAEECARETGAAVEYSTGKTDPRDYRVSFAKLQNEFGVETLYTPERGIREVVTALRDSVFLDPLSSRYGNA